MGDNRNTGGKRRRSRLRRESRRDAAPTGGRGCKPLLRYCRQSCRQEEVMLENFQMGKSGRDTLLREIGVGKPLLQPSLIQVSTSHFSCPISHTQYPTSQIQPPTSNIRLPASDIQLPTSDFRLPTSDLRLPTSDFQLPTSNFQHPTSNFRPPTSNMRLSNNQYKPFN